MVAFTDPQIYAQDAKGCQDSPLPTRFPGSVIDSCKDTPDDAATLHVGNQRKKIEGEIQEIRYNLPKGLTQAQLLRNIKTALQTAGFVQDYDSGNGDLTYHKGGRSLAISSNMGGTYYSQTIIGEIQLQQQMFADAAALSKGIAGAGHVVATGIFFDTGKADIKPESAAALKEIAKLLQQDPALKVYVVGHTDNVGILAANLELSRRRAAAVAHTLSTDCGVPAARLQSFGAGPYAPVASNDSEEGRAQNRRVELVKQ